MDSLENAFTELHRLFSAQIPPFELGGDEQGMFRGKRNFHLVVPKAVVVPGAYGKPTKLAMASLIMQKGYVGFYFMPVYMNGPLKAKLSPALVKLLKGKTCFHVKKLDAALLTDIAEALRLGTSCYRERGWV